MIFKLSVINDHVWLKEGCMMHPDANFKTLIALTHVCYQWRNVALENPQLWTRLTFDGEHNGHLSAFVTRAKGSLLDIHIIANGFDTFDDDDSVLKQCAGRIRHVQLSMTEVVHAERLEELVTSPIFTSVECLRICIAPNANEDDLGYTTLPLNRTLISGQKVSGIKALAMDALSPLAFIPANDFPHLTHARINWSLFGMPDLMFFLSHAPRLEDLVFEMLLWDDSLEACIPVKVPSMKLVTFNHSDISAIFDILSHIILPNCASVRIHGAHMDGVEWLHQAGTNGPQHTVRFTVEQTTHLEICMASSSTLFVLAESSSNGLWLELNDHNWEQVADVFCLRNLISFSTISSLILKVTFRTQFVSPTFLDSFPELKSLTLHLEYGRRLPFLGAESLVRRVASSSAACKRLHSLLIICDMSPECIQQRPLPFTITTELLGEQLKNDFNNASASGDPPLHRFAFEVFKEQLPLPATALHREFLRHMLHLWRDPHASLGRRVEELECSESRRAEKAKELTSTRIHEWSPFSEYWASSRGSDT